MPTYTYRCDNDDCPNSTPFDVQHPMSVSAEGDECLLMQTGHGYFRRVYTPVAAVFRGKGWGKG